MSSRGERTTIAVPSGICCKLTLKIRSAGNRSTAPHHGHAATRWALDRLLGGTAARQAPSGWQERWRYVLRTSGEGAETAQSGPGAFST